MKKVVKKEKVNVPQLKSVVGEKQYKKMEIAEIQGGATVEEAPELIARRLAKQNPQ